MENNLLDLIQGADVEWQPLGEICDIKRGKRLVRSQLTETGKYPVYQNSMTPLGFYDEYNFTGDNTFIICAGAAGEIGYMSENFWAADDVSVLTTPSNLMSRYLYHFLLTQKSSILSKVRRASVPRLSKIAFERIEIPIPSLEIQQKVVEILDKMTDYVTELTAELTLRQKQYSYYRDQLLTFGAEGNPLSDSQESLTVRWTTLGEIGENLDNKRKPITKNNRIAGEFPYYGASGIVDYVEDYIFDGDFLLISEDGANLLARSTPIAFSVSGKIWVNNHAHVVKFDNYATRKFVEYYFSMIDISKYISTAAQPKLTQENLNKIEIPLPPLKLQAKIVEILDKFQALTEDVSGLLPEEIALRQKQYAYYREQLLTFGAQSAKASQPLTSSYLFILREAADKVGVVLDDVLRVIWTTLGEIATFKYGFTDKARDNGNARFIRITDINESGKLKKSDMKYLDLTEENEAFLVKKDDILMARTGATFGKTVKFDEDYPAIYASFLINIGLDTSKILPSFYWHFAQSTSYWNQANALVSGGGQPQFNANVLKIVKLPVPSLSEQKRVVKILDKFDHLTSDLTDGLPREIELRQKQYEYWREQLLSFKKHIEERGKINDKKIKN